MAQASMARRARRQRGRPNNGTVNQMERLEIALATALQIAWNVNEREAFDLVVAMAEGLEKPTPHGVSSQLRMVTFAGRTSTLKKKRRRLPPDEITALMTLALRCKDLAAAARLFRSLLSLAAVRGPDAMHQAVLQLLAQ